MSTSLVQKLLTSGIAQSSHLVEFKYTSDELAQVDMRVGQVDPARRILVEVRRRLRGGGDGGK